MREDIDPALHSRVIVEGVAVKVDEFRDIPLHDGALKERGDVGFYKGSRLEADQALETLDKQHHVFVVNILANRHYFAFAMGSIEVGVEVAQVGLILYLCCGFWQGVATRIRFRGSVRVRRWDRRKGLPQEQGLYDDLP